MEHVKDFLDISTIHGLSWISSTRRWSRLVWILIVLGGFSGAGYLIFESIDNWKSSPISTTIETLPISKLTFPNVTVCPPKNSYLNLNYDISKSDNVELHNDTRNKLLDFAMDVISDEFYQEMMTNLSKLEDHDRYYNWYHGFTQITYPYYNEDKNELNFDVATFATSGNISTKYFGANFDAVKFDANIYIGITVNVPPRREWGDGDTTLILNIQKNSIKEFSNNDKISFCNIFTEIDADLTEWNKNITNPRRNVYSIKLNRDVSKDDLNNIALDTMPGFIFTWNYDKDLEPDAHYRNVEITKQFVR